MKPLSQKLKQRFGSSGQTAKYRAELRARRRGKMNHSKVSTKDIRRLLVLAYPGDSPPSAEAIAMESFLQALDDRDFETRLCEKEYDTLDEIFRHALRLEANDRAISSRHEFKRTGGNQARGLVRDDSFDQIRKQLEQVVVNQQRSENNFRRLEDKYQQLKSIVVNPIRQAGEAGTIPQSTSDLGTNQFRLHNSSNDRRRHRQTNNNLCFNCGLPGHFAASCNNSNHLGGVENGNQRNLNETQAAPLVDVNPVNHTPPPVRVGGIEESMGTGCKVYLNMMLNGRPQICLLDTGCELSIVLRSLIIDRQLEPSELKMKAANGTEILVDGRTSLTFELGSMKVDADVLVSDHVFEVILGYDWLRQGKATWDFNKMQITIEG